MTDDLLEQVFTSQFIQSDDANTEYKKRARPSWPATAVWFDRAHFLHGY